MRSEWLKYRLKVQDNNPTNIQDIRTQLHDRGICVVIPTFNNENTIEQVVRDTLVYCEDVFVVNDGCTDTTSDILSKIEGIQVVSYSANKGKGYALKAGFKKALSAGFSYAITLDSDGQHFPKDIPLFLKANIRHPHSIIVGERKLSGVVRTKGSNFANKFSNFWFYVQTGKRLKDTQTGYRLYPLKLLRGLNGLTRRYEAELELLVFASWHGVSIHSIPIEVYYPSLKERVSHFRPGKDFARITVLNTVLCFLAVVYGLPLRICRLCGVVIRTAYSAFVSIFSLMFIMTPWAWIIMHTGTPGEQRNLRLHRLMLQFARFVMIKHGIPGVKFEVENSVNETFEKPAIIICNHQSHIDLTSLLIFHPKVVFLTNNWVWKNPVYGSIIRQAEYLPAYEGLDAMMPQLRSLIGRGYSVAVFPEGTRSIDGTIGRFHKGAVHIAKELNVDILPIFLYGAGRILPKTSFYLRKGLLKVFIKERIPAEELQLVESERLFTQKLHRYYVAEYRKICNNLDQKYYG